MLTGAPNFRDLGGYTTRSGGHVRRGKIYRSSQLSRLTDTDIETVQALSLSATIDLRCAQERAAQPTAAGARSAFEHVSPKPDTDFIFNRIFAKADRTAEAWARSFADFYAMMLDDYAPEFVAMFRAIADDHLPLLVHCSAGKDRTGAAAALILDLLGVDRATILEDYLRSSMLLDSDAHFENMLSDAKLDLYSDLPIECRRVMLGTDHAYLDALFAALESRFGTTRDYLLHHGLSDDQVATITAAMIEPTTRQADVISA
ncbi:tyrosine-protein phosphatase [Sphingomonas sp. CGMCC 1.13654]|uniref:Tyrosine-protein phosphatase n=2 Tax=Sphingomonas chungangi TaxID=2683589 RepID=A0A838L8L6_9SPHN|nr:tyrosine-protein phosphatase [Sphingomonas chungangi]MBA2935524.1 tyrosine-protein phosphatase [Sphingomonas chungangi]MVW57031.1 protein-tyrosine-phosphatase [Sphingomonas chungangi]